MLNHPGQSRWSFEFSSRFADSRKQAGQFVALNEMTQIKESEGIQYIEHTSTGTRQGTPDGPTEFQVQWVAPEAP